MRMSSMRFDWKGFRNYIPGSKVFFNNIDISKECYFADEELGICKCIDPNNFFNYIFKVGKIKIKVPNYLERFIADV